MNKRLRIISIRLSEAEYGAQLSDAKQAGYASLGLYVRDRVLGAENEKFKSSLTALYRRLEVLEETVGVSALKDLV